MSGISPDIPIRFVHDANSVLAGEIWKGNARGFRNAAVVTLGTGLGFSVSENGKVLCNEIGGPLLPIFKIPYRDGILEDYTAQRGILKKYMELSGNTDTEGIRVSDIGKWADNGDLASIQTFREVGKILAETLNGILVERNVECLLFSGQISRSFQYMEPSLKEGLKKVECLKKISVVKSIDDAALWGLYKRL
jgi:glucokinase